MHAKRIFEEKAKGTQGTGKENVVYLAKSKRVSKFSKLSVADLPDTCKRGWNSDPSGAEIEKVAKDIQRLDRNEIVQVQEMEKYYIRRLDANCRSSYTHDVQINHRELVMPLDHANYSQQCSNSIPKRHLCCV
jgi:hypothetical protein